MEVHLEPDSEEPENWIDLTGDVSGTTESPTWKLEMYTSAEGMKTEE